MLQTRAAPLQFPPSGCRLVSRTALSFPAGRRRSGVRFVAILTLGWLGLALTTGNAFAANAPRPALKVAIVSGAETYQSDRAFTGLAEYLSSAYGMRVDLMSFDPAGTSIPGIERLLTADTAVFHVRRKTVVPEQLAVLKRFFASGKGFVALRSTSHGWENWKEFDRDVLGMKYGGTGGVNMGNAERLLPLTHPVWEGVVGLGTVKDLYRVSDAEPDVSVILEGETKNGRTPVAWTRPHGHSRLVYIGLFYELDQLPLRRAIANALFWVTSPELK